MLVGSSATRMFGRDASALAMATLCLSPPLSWWGSLCDTSSGLSPTSVRRETTCSRISGPFFSPLSFTSGVEITVSTLCLGLSEPNGSWKAIWTSFLYHLVFLPLSLVTSSPL